MASQHRSTIKEVLHIAKRIACADTCLFGSLHKRHVRIHQELTNAVAKEQRIANFVISIARLNKLDRRLTSTDERQRSIQITCFRFPTTRDAATGRWIEIGNSRCRKFPLKSERCLLYLGIVSVVPDNEPKTILRPLLS